MRRLIFLCVFCISLCGMQLQAQTACDLTIHADVQNPSCAGGMDGKINLRLDGTYGSAQVSWSDGGEGLQRSALPAGEYVVKVETADGCFVSEEIELKEGEELENPLIIRKEYKKGEGAVLNVAFANGKKPAMVTIKDLSKGIRAPRVPYKGSVLKKGQFSIEAFTEAGCSRIERINIDIN